MPNHVTTILHTAPHVIGGLSRVLTAQEQLDAHEAERENWKNMKQKTLADFKDRKIVDFEMVVPSPPNKEKGNCSGDHANGEVCWYNWNSENWGTKWNAYDVVLDDRTDRVQFDTAWAHPLPVITALSKLFPEEQLVVEYADEDFGYNCGKYTMLNGEVIEDTSPDGGSDAAKELAAQVKYGMPYAEVQAEWDQDEIDWARTSCFASRLAEERGINRQDAHKAIREEGLSIPQDIVDQLDSIVAVENYYATN